MHDLTANKVESNANVNKILIRIKTWRVKWRY